MRKEDDRISITFKVSKQTFEALQMYLDLTGMTRQGFLEFTVSNYLGTYKLAMKGMIEDGKE